MNIDRGAAWCIVRTAAPSTLRLADELTRAGMPAWTPRLVAKRRRGRQRQQVEQPAAILPSFVFVRGDTVDDLRATLARPSSRFPSFSIFRHAGRIPLIGDADVAALRAEESQAAAAWAREQERVRLGALKASAPVFEAGAPVHVPQVAFTGMAGVVTGQRGKLVTVDFGNGRSMKIGAWLLETGELQAA